MAEKQILQNTLIIPAAIFGTRNVHKPEDKWRVHPRKKAVMIVGAPVTPAVIFAELDGFNAFLNRKGVKKIGFHDLLMLHIGELLPDGFEYENKVVSRTDRWGYYINLVPAYLTWKATL